MKISDLFMLNGPDRRYLTTLVVLGVVVVVLMHLLDSKVAPAASSANVERQESDSSRSEAQTRNNYVGDIPQERKVERFAFDPNTADSTALLRLGLQPWQVRNIYKYRAKGGIYRTKEDFARLYGLTVKEYKELEPYIRISPDYLPASTLFDSVPERTESHRTASDTLRPRFKLIPGETIDLTTADTTELKKVPGIGSYYASRIVNYRNRLGGFLRKEQLCEINGFPSESLPYFILSEIAVKKMAINRLKLNEMRYHPYMGYYRAAYIIDYRQMHGNIEDLNELTFSQFFTAEDIEKLRPYVEY